ncbi:MAG: hypothetical protein ABIM74_07275 [candidate division WOR-3 bacterium]
MILSLSFAMALVSKSPPAIITGDVQDVKNFELLSFVGDLCSVDVDRDGNNERFFVSESRGWQDEWIDGRWVAYEVRTKRLNEARGSDTIGVASYTFSFQADEKPPMVFASVGFLDANEDRVLDLIIAIWDDEGFSEMTVYDLSGLNDGTRHKIATLSPDLKWPSYEFAWPRLMIKSPAGKREYLWREGSWIELD